MWAENRGEESRAVGGALGYPVDLQAGERAEPEETGSTELLQERLRSGADGVYFPGEANI